MSRGSMKKSLKGADRCASSCDNESSSQAVPVKHYVTNVIMAKTMKNNVTQASKVVIPAGPKMCPDDSAYSCPAYGWSSEPTREDCH